MKNYKELTCMLQRTPLAAVLRTDGVGKGGQWKGAEVRNKRSCMRFLW